MQTFQTSFVVETRGKRLHDVTEQVRRAVAESGVARGLCHVFCAHTSASLVIQENADPAVLRDMDRWMSKLAPEEASYEHDAEGADDMPAHLRATVTRTGETVPVTGGGLALGTWQAIYLWEHRRAPHRRTLTVTVLGEP